MDEEKVAATASALADSKLAVLQEWIQCNSFSAEVDNVNDMGERFARAFSGFALTTERWTCPRGVHHYWLQSAAAENHSTMLLVGHHDTVFPPGHFDVWENDGETLHGPGVIDMKGGLFVMYCAIAALDELGALPKIPVAVLCVGDEEIGSVESKPWLQNKGSGARAALVFEAGRQEDKIITSRKGTGKMTVDFVGRAAHAGNRHAEGRNAIAAAARFTLAAQAHTNYELGVTVNVGLISGGTAVNTVPEGAQLRMDFRFLQQADGEEVVAAMHKHADAAAEKEGCEVKISGGISRDAWPASSANRQLMQSYAACAKASGLGGSECETVGGGSDANLLAAVGVPAIDGLGPAGSGFHTLHERMEKASLARKAAALARFLVRTAV